MSVSGSDQIRVKSFKWIRVEKLVENGSGCESLLQSWEVVSRSCYHKLKEVMAALEHARSGLDQSQSRSEVGRDQDSHAREIGGELRSREIRSVSRILTEHRRQTRVRWVCKRWLYTTNLYRSCRKAESVTQWVDRVDWQKGDIRVSEFSWRIRVFWDKNYSRLLDL